MHCGMPLIEGLASPVAPAKKQSGHWGLKFFFFLLFLGLIAGAYFGYGYYQQKVAEQIAADSIARQLAIQDSIAQAEYEAKLVEDSLKQVAAAHRVEDLEVLVGEIYNCRKGHPNDVVGYYSLGLKNAYLSWENENLQGPQGLLFERKWEGGCDNRLKIKNYQTEVLEASSPEDNAATFKVKVTFSIYDSVDDDSFVKDVAHTDVFKFVNEHGNWRIDDLIRDGLSVKSRYSSGSSDFGKETCH